MPGACLGLVRVLPASSAIMGCRSPGRAFANNGGIQKFPKYQVQDPGGCVCIRSVQLKPLSLPRDCSWEESSDPREAGAQSPGQGEAGLGFQRLLEKPRLPWSDQPAPRSDTDPWRYRRAPVPSWSSLSSASGRAAGACWEQGQQLPEFWPEVQLQAPTGRRCSAHTATQHYRLGTAGRAHIWHS